MDITLSRDRTARLKGGHDKARKDRKCHLFTRKFSGSFVMLTA